MKQQLSQSLKSKNKRKREKSTSSTPVTQKAVSNGQKSTEKHKVVIVNDNIFENILNSKEKQINGAVDEESAKRRKVEQSRIQNKCGKLRTSKQTAHLF
uniref:Uncharacterized protein n=1 Tax=Ditylenchus dipsaci TaxID=166011 RepID=A0A915DI64_9BILA